MHPCIRISGAIALALGLGGMPVQAQQINQTLDRGQIVSPVLTVDSDRVFWQSAYGKRVRGEIAQLQAQLTAENTEIRDALAQEEKQLTEQRAGMEAEAFRLLADAFDQKVQETAAAQNAKALALQNLPDQEVAAVLTRAAPVFERLMRDAGAVVILERGATFVSAAAIEITDAAIAAIDRAIGDGTDRQE